MITIKSLLSINNYNENQIIDILYKLENSSIHLKSLVIKSLISKFIELNYDYHNILAKLLEFDNIKIIFDENDYKLIKESTNIIYKDSLNNYKNYLENNDISNNIINDNKRIHIGYPTLVDNIGAPNISLLKCHYTGCSKRFNNEVDFYRHLQSHIPGFMHSLHKSHHLISDNLKLNASKIISLNITKCPSAICDQKNRVFTNQELIDHFKILGIKPFWCDDLSIQYPFKTHFNIIKNENRINEYIESDIIVINKYINKQQVCVACIDKMSNIILLPCSHNILCEDCLKYLSSDKCPYCRSTIDSFLQC